MKLAMQTCCWKLQKNEKDEESYNEAAKLIKNGEVVAFPTETVYGLGADGLNSEAVKKIFVAKGRPNDNPLILHIADLKDIELLTTGLNANAKALAEAFWPGPLTMIVNKSSLVPDEVSAGLPTVAVRFPGNPEARAFIKACGCPIAAPSANISGRPSPTNAEDVLEDMQSKIAGIIDGGICDIGVESTIVDTTTPVPMILRPGGITYEMLLEVLGAVDIDKALKDANFKPKAPGMKYRHYAPKASMYIVNGATWKERGVSLALIVLSALHDGLKVGVICSEHGAVEIKTMVRVAKEGTPLYDGDDIEKFKNMSCDCTVCTWANEQELAEGLFSTLRDFDRLCPDVIVSEGVAEDGIGLAIMNRMRKAAGYQEIVRRNKKLEGESQYMLVNGDELPEFLAYTKREW